MAELVVAGPEPMQRKRIPLRNGQIVRLGRAPRNGEAIPWDGLISREHAELCLDGGKLKVRRLDTARNPIYFHEMESTDFEVASGDQFRIGHTYFSLSAIELDDSESPSQLEEHSYGPGELNQFKFRNADLRLEVLSKLPRLLAKSGSDEELATQLVKLVLEAIPHVDGAAVAFFKEFTAPGSTPQMICSSSREGTPFSPSRRLIMAALERNQSKLHLWHDAEESDPQYTVSGNLDWAFCTPIKQQACRGWCLYCSGKIAVSIGSGQFLTEDDLKGDLRFAELLADFIGASKQVRYLEFQHAGLAPFLPPAVMEELRGKDRDTVLKPKETDITVLFCDVRGFSRKAELAEQNLKELLDRVSDALRVMTVSIVKYDGVIADFQGDAALGFWGWPKAQPEGPLLAARAALEIQAEFEKARNQSGHSLADFRVGIGIAHGRAIAGKIGNEEQIKVGAFGPVVNLGARLEGMTKQLRAPILMDEATAKHVREFLHQSQGRCRRLGKVRPVGMSTNLMVTELLPPEGVGTISDATVADYEDAVDAVVDGRWNEAIELLDRLPVEDRAKDFLMIFIAINQYEPPEDWDGVVRLISK